MELIKPEINAVSAWFSEHWVATLMIILIGAAAYYIGRRLLKILVRRTVRISGQRHVWHERDIEKRQNTLVDLFATIWRFAVIFTVAYALLREFVPNISTTLAPLFASAGIIGVALGFGAQSLIKDFLSGIFIISENQYRVGDVVDLEGAAGTVERIGSRSTMLRDVEGNVHFIPNGLVGHVINKTMGYSIARVVISVVPETDIEKAASIIDQIGNKMAKEEKWQQKIIEAPQYVMMGELTATAAELIVSGKVQPSDQWSVSAELRRRILRGFEAKDIELGINSGAYMTSTQKTKRHR